MRKYRRRAFRGQTGEKAGCTCPCAANYDPTATTNDDSCMYTGGPSPVGIPDGIKPTINRPTNVFRRQSGFTPPNVGGPMDIVRIDVDESKLTDADREALKNRPKGPTQKTNTMRAGGILGVVAVVAVVFLLIRKRK